MSLLGLGYLYVGRIGYGVALVMITAGALALAGWSRIVMQPAGLYTMAAASVVVAVFPVMHAALIASRNPQTRAKQYNRVWVYLAWFGGLSLLGNGLISSRADLFGYEPFSIPSVSMAPTLLRGDRIMTDTWRYDRADPEYGELVVFEIPDQPDQVYAKRILGKAGDEIELRDNRLFRDGTLVDEPYVQILDGRALPLDHFGPIVVPAESFFMLGDNRRNSRDSRFFGSVPRDLIRGRIEFRYFALDGKIRWDRFPEMLVPDARAATLQVRLDPDYSPD